VLQLSRAPLGPDLVGAVLDGYLRCFGSPNSEANSRLQHLPQVRAADFGFAGRDRSRALPVISATPQRD
jgi:hypothetical protein